MYRKGFYNVNLDDFDTIFDFLSKEFVDDHRISTPINMYSDDENNYCEINLAGYMKNDIELTIEDNLMKIKADNEVPERKYFKNEIISGLVEKEFKINKSIDVNKISSEFKNGILLVTLPLKEKSKPKSVKIN